MPFKKYVPFFTILTILFIGAFLRLYRIEDYMGFLGDEGRDVLVVKRMLVDHDFTLLGPITSVGLMHLGPMYYYFMLPFLWLSNLHPVGPAIMVALFSIATIWLIWKVGREYFDLKTATIASLLYALSPLVINYSHSSWNPNILPFWGLLLIYSLLKVTAYGKKGWLVVTGLSLGIALQLHYVSLVFIPLIFVSLFLHKKQFTLKNFLLVGSGFLLTFWPFLLFEARHHFINIQTVFQFMIRTGDAKSFSINSFFGKFFDLSERLFWRLIVIKSEKVSQLFLFATVGVGTMWLFFKKQSQDLQHIALKQLLLWYGIGIGFLSFYTGNIYDYYLMFAFPLPFILVGWLSSKLSGQWLGKMMVIGAITYISFWHIQETSILREPNRIVKQTRDISNFILEKTGGEPYNFALITGQNSDHAYRYFLETEGHPPVIIKNPSEDPGRSSVTSQLFVLCEETKCEPLGHPLWEIAGFGRAEIVEEWEVGFYKVKKLVHYVEI